VILWLPIRWSRLLSEFLWTSWVSSWELWASLYTLVCLFPIRCCTVHIFNAKKLNRIILGHDCKKGYQRCE
jgi:hypothetical protein